MQGLEGIKNKIPAPTITAGSSYDAPKAGKKLTPKDLYTAFKYFEESDFINRVYGDEVHNHLIKFFRNEIYV